MAAQPASPSEPVDTPGGGPTSPPVGIDERFAPSKVEHGQEPNFSIDSNENFEATMVQAMSLPIIDPRSVRNNIPKAPDDETSLQDFPTLGYIGRYALKYQLGQGGLGTVYAALDPLLSRPIALKTLRVDADRSQRDAFESMLLAEARAAAGLNHPNIVTVFDAGLSEHGVYIAMEKLKGEDLKQRLANGWRPDTTQAATVVARVAEALDYAHDQGVVHCDVKPANIFMVGALNPKVVDFGIAKVAHAVGVDIPLQLAPADALSPYYAAPEQIQGGTVDSRSDVYALGVVLYELLTGARPYQGNTIDELKHAVATGHAPTAHQRVPKVSPALSAIAAKAMALEPGQRYRTAGLLAQALQRCAGDATALRAHRRRVSMTSGLALATLVVGAAAWLGMSMQSGGDVSASDQRPTMPPNASALAGLGLALPSVGSATSRSPFVDGTRLANAMAHPSLASAAASPTPSNADTSNVATTDKQATRSDARWVVKASTKSTPAIVMGSVQLAVAPWGHIEVNGRPAGVTPPLSSLTLPSGQHRIVIRNADFPPHVVTVVVDAQRSAIVRHRFGS